MMDSITIVIIFTLLFTKHFVCDFLLQGPFQYLNKGTYGHLGGILHSLIQVMGTLIVLYWYIPINLLFYVTICEFIVHYHIDWAKMNLNKYLLLTPSNSEQFWWLLGFDQYLHYLTYSIMMWALLKF